MRTYYILGIVTFSLFLLFANANEQHHIQKRSLFKWKIFDFLTGGLPIKKPKTPPMYFVGTVDQRVPIPVGYIQPTQAKPTAYSPPRPVYPTQPTYSPPQPSYYAQAAYPAQAYSAPAYQQMPNYPQQYAPSQGYQQQPMPYSSSAAQSTASVPKLPNESTNSTLIGSQLSEADAIRFAALDSNNLAALNDNIKDRVA